MSDDIRKAFKIYIKTLKKKDRKKKLKNLLILFWNFLCNDISAYNYESEFIVFLKSTGNFYKLSRENFYTTIGILLDRDGKQMENLARNPESIDAMFLMSISDKKEFSLEFFIYNNIIFYYYRGNIYPTIMYLSFKFNDIVTYMLVKIIDPPSNLILDFYDFKKIYNIDHPPLSLVSYESGIEKMLRTLPDKHCETLDCCSRNPSYMNHHISDECIIFQGSESQVQLFIHLPQKDVYNIVIGYLGNLILL